MPSQRKFTHKRKYNFRKEASSKMVGRILIRLWEYSDHIKFRLLFFIPNSEELETKLQTKFRRNC